MVAANKDSTEPMVKFTSFRRHHDLVNSYEISTDMFHLSQALCRHFLTRDLSPDL